MCFPKKLRQIYPCAWRGLNEWYLGTVHIYKGKQHEPFWIFAIMWIIEEPARFGDDNKIKSKMVAPKVRFHASTYNVVVVFDPAIFIRSGESGAITSSSYSSC